MDQKEAKAKVGKAPTRLQKHAPASLQLDKIAVAAAATAGPFSASGETPKAIPLLSPLVLSPEPFSETVEKRLLESGNGEKRSLDSPAGGWKHPAVAAFTEPPNLLTRLQSQCVLVDNVQ